MGSYQDLVLDRLRYRAKDVSYSIHMGYASNGRLIAHEADALTTLATLDFDFTFDQVQMSLNGGVEVGKPLPGKRSSTIFCWTPGDPEDDGELSRLLSAWAVAVDTALRGMGL